jgi:hypothetical protein
MNSEEPIPNQDVQSNPTSEYQSKPPSWIEKRGKIYVEMYNPVFVDLQTEVAHHPDLRMNMFLQGADRMEERLAEVGTYCGVALDGYYTPERLVVVCEEFLKILRAKRLGHVYTPSESVSMIVPNVSDVKN